MKRSVLYFLFVVLVGPFAHGQEVLFISPALSLLVQHADQTYARVYNESAQNFFVNNPVNAAVVMGLAMHGQKLVADRDPQFLRHYEALRREAHDFLGELARVHGHRNPSDGQPMTRESLATVFDRNASGEYNQWAVQHRMPDPALVPPPMILDKISPESLAKLHLKEPDSVFLLGQEASRVERHEGIDAIHRFFETQPGLPQPPVERSAVQENDIVGVWYAHEVRPGEARWGGSKYRFLESASPLEFTSHGKPGHYIGRHWNIDPDLRIALDRIVPKEQHPKNFNGFIYTGTIRGRFYAHIPGMKDSVVSERVEVKIIRDDKNRLRLDYEFFRHSSHIFFREKVMDW